MAMPTYSMTQELQLKLASSAQLSSGLQLKTAETTLEYCVHISICHHVLSTTCIFLACLSWLLLNTNVLSGSTMCIAAWKVARTRS